MKLNLFFTIIFLGFLTSCGSASIDTKNSDGANDIKLTKNPALTKTVAKNKN
jgi:hypothetical protein